MQERRTEKTFKGKTYTNKKLVIVDDKLELQYSGENYFVDRTFIRAYDCDGNYIKDVHQDSPEYTEAVTWIHEHPYRVLIQIGYEFMLIPTDGAGNVTEISNVIYMLRDSELFPYNFDGNGLGNFRGYDRISSTLFDIASTKRAISSKQIENLLLLKYEFNKNCEEVCYCGRHLSIISDAQNKFDLDKYTHNYKKALIDYPDWKMEIERLYLLNVGIHKWKVANVANKISNL
jgi:hypothetical protein